MLHSVISSIMRSIELPLSDWSAVALSSARSPILARKSPSVMPPHSVAAGIASPSMQAVSESEQWMFAMEWPEAAVAEEAVAEEEKLEGIDDETRVRK